MMHRYCFEALDRTLRDILRFKDASIGSTFGGKIVVLGGDFRQILPVITKGTRQDIVNAALNSSYLWNHCHVLKLTKNMRLEGNQVESHLNDLRQFSDWVLAIGDGMIENFVDGIEKVHIPDVLLINNCDDPISVIVEVMLLRNIDQSLGLCNGTRLFITRLGNRVIEAKVLSGNMAGEKVFIPRMSLIPSDARIPFKFQRRQFPIVVSFAMTINKSQGQSLSHVGLYLKKQVFTHGQLYVALSRVTNRSGLKILIYDDDGEISNEATNKVYKEVFRNLLGQ
ncbi:PREDICTED: ATP-dependent DNA helicase PIF1-like [Nicotiana attenuata]|uniref:ATP-dependent DNA helicase PIF1-like n=1 Tax=Nicotiana attenuata TaxID=49451 RepID=UPI0009058DC3|nr:PREDICTED: ATP-dependent DNA helicase PIF1-like [Nicotiana attenuata]